VSQHPRFDQGVSRNDRTPQDLTKLSVLLFPCDTNKSLIVDFQLKMHHKALGGQAPPGPTGQAHSAPADFLAGY